MLAATSLGAIWSSCSPDFGVRGVLDRFGQIEPKLLFATDGYRYAGKTFDLSERVAEIRAALPSLSQAVTVRLRRRRRAPGRARRSASSLARARASSEFERLPFDHPLFILYSSGTTGAPKCIVHGAGAVLAKIAVEQRLHTDLRRDDRLFYFTTCGWMMWNWLATGLATEARRSCSTTARPSTPTSARSSTWSTPSA